jgi:GNAT superfamily N-acetyltransferase
VATSGLIIAAGIPCLIGVVTIPEFRRRGIGACMTRAALDHARALGHRMAFLGTSDMGRGIYERMGFRFVCTSLGYVAGT